METAFNIVTLGESVILDKGTFINMGNVTNQFSFAPMYIGKKTIKLWSDIKFMDKYMVLAEMLYIIANYEKGKIKTSLLWSKRYINSLEESVNIMLQIIDLMKNQEKIYAHMIRPIIELFLKRKYIVFSEIGMEKFYSDDMHVIFEETPLVYEDIINFMERILSECIFLLKNKGYGYKTRLSYLLKALHNLPRVFLNSHKQSFFGIGVCAMCKEEAMESAIFYIDLEKRMRSQ